ncbi:unnamed protein product [Mesocestoides corti]|uniref:Uncharacterized protein n=1 Tax=Mesocestoides corti TaxID=53468 RepID=A0A0R3UC51_MESCO|nr:unnamed protein product [Mesocestoides corti]
MDQFDARMLQAEKDLASHQSRAHARITRLRRAWPIKRTVYLDPRELETPHILCLGPPHSAPTSATSVTVVNDPNKAQAAVPNYLDNLSADDVKTPCLVPSSVQR